MLCVLVSCLAGAAGASAGPFAGVPPTAKLTLVVDNPRKLAETLRDLPGVAAAMPLPAVQDALKTPAVRRFAELVGYYERDLGADWPEVLDLIAGNGVTVASVTSGKDPDPVVLVMRGTDPAAVEKFVAGALKLLETEAAKAAVGGAEPDKLRTADYHGVTTSHFGAGFHLARAGAVVTVSNTAAFLHQSLDAAAGRTPSLADSAQVAAGRKLVGPGPLAWAWYDLTALKAGQQGKDFFANTRKEIVQTLVFGGTIDAVRRADFVTAGLFADAGNARVNIRLPAPRSGLPAELAVHVPNAGEVGSLPLLNPPGTVYSQSFYLDVAKLWADRTKLFNPQALKDVEKFNTDVSKVLPGPGFGGLLEAAGPHHRVVVVAPPAETLYQSTPRPVLPGAALVISMRNKQFGESASAAARTGAALASFSTGLAMTEEVVGGVTVVSYRFPDGKPLVADPDDTRFQAAPSFAVVGDFFVVASRPDVLKSLIPELQKPAGKGNLAVWRAQSSGPGLAAWVRNQPDAFVADVVLRQGVTVTAAKTQVRQLADVLEKSGPVTLAFDHKADCYEIALGWLAK